MMGESMADEEVILDAADGKGEADDATIAAILSASIKPDTNSDELSPEDAAWADSCLVAISDESWASFKEALLDALAAPFTPIQEDPIAEETTKSKEQAEDGKESLTKLTGREDTDEDSDDGESFAGSEDDVESRESIFKVWDLVETTQEVEDEEDELTKQLRAAIEESEFRAREVEELTGSLQELSLQPSSAEEIMA